MRKRNDWSEHLLKTLWEMLEVLKSIDKKVEKIMTVQADLAADATAISGAFTEVQTTLTDMAAQVTQIGTDVAAIQTALANGQPVDTSAIDALAAQAATLQASVQSADSSLDTAVQSVTALTPAAS
jgi:hypothetical protein